MEMISNLPIELRVEIFRRFVDLRAISKDMKTELQNKWFQLYYDKAWKLIIDRQYNQCIDMVLFMRNTVKEKDMNAFNNRIVVIMRVLLMADMDSETMLIEVENIFLLKWKSQLFRKSLSWYDVNSSINVDWHANNFINELPTSTGNKWSKKAILYEYNRHFVKELGRDNFQTIFDFLNKFPLSFLIVAFKYYECEHLENDLVHLIVVTSRYHSHFMDYLFELKESNCIRLFVEKVTCIRLFVENVNSIQLGQDIKNTLVVAIVKHLKKKAYEVKNMFMSVFEVLTNCCK